VSVASSFDLTWSIQFVSIVPVQLGSYYSGRKSHTVVYPYLGEQRMSSFPVPLSADSCSKPHCFELCDGRSVQEGSELVKTSKSAVFLLLKRPVVNSSG
jgi:hypothetical protein